MKPCLHCKNEGRLAVTEFFRGWSVDDDWVNKPPKHGLKHWCDDGKAEHEWSEGKRYIHGHSALAGDIRLDGYATKQDVIEAWNTRMTPIIEPSLSFWSRLFSFWR